MSKYDNFKTFSSNKSALTFVKLARNKGRKINFSQSGKFSNEIRYCVQYSGRKIV